ncbi:MAG: transposase [Gammaproteobacteria bacterium]|nr:transposase [Gammaproteobacteria bacterium]
MTLPRSQLISYNDTPYYHIISRCVRQSYLCGIDPDTQKNYEHRKQWIEDRIRILSSLFSIVVCAYSVMSSHYHLILMAIPEESNDWSDKDVIRRWLTLFRGPSVAQKYIQNEVLKPNELEAVNKLIPIWRSRLTDISWFMKCLNEPIARAANKEEGKEGNFWISRFRSEALLDEEAVLTAMAYVDLNPVRASIAKTPESSEYTSVKERINPQFNLSEAIKSYCEQGGFPDHLCCDDNPIPIRALAPFNEGEIHERHTLGINFHLHDYLELVDYSGRAIREDKTGHIKNTLPPILERLGISQKIWFENCQNFEAHYSDRFAPKLLFSG